MAVFLLSACGGAGGGLSPISPGASGGVTQSTPTPTPSPTPTPKPGAITLGTPVFNPASDGTGDCGAQTGVEIVAIGATAVIPISQANYTGAYVATASDSTVLSATVNATTLTVTAIAAGTATVTVRDSVGDSTSCAFGVTSSGGTVQ